MIVFRLRDAKSVRRSHREEGGVAEEIGGVGIDGLARHYGRLNSNCGERNMAGRIIFKDEDVRKNEYFNRDWNGMTSSWRDSRSGRQTLFKLRRYKTS